MVYRMTAQFRTECGEDCGHPIEPGDDIELDDWRKWRHVHCPDDPDEVADRAALAVGRCSRCGLHHPGEC